MKREIKFRGYSPDMGKWIYGYYANMEDGSCPTIIHAQGNNAMQHTLVEQDSVGQFTGRHDCAGNEIYENDIIDFDRGEWRGPDHIHLVTWSNDYSEWCWGGGGNGDMEWRRVIGNTFENPDLNPEK